MLATALTAVLLLGGIGTAHADSPAPAPGAVVVVPDHWTDPATGHDWTLDPTGRTDVSDALNLWLGRGLTDGTIPAGTQGAPTVVQFPAGAQYRVEYGLQLGSTGVSRAHPDVPRYRARHLVLDLNGGRLFQTSTAVFQAGKPVVEPRKRWGVQLLKIRLGTDVTVRNGTIEGSHATLSDATFTPHESWIGVQLSGCTTCRLQDLTITHVWSDFVYLGQSLDPTEAPGTIVHNRDIALDHVTMDVNGRQGITTNDVIGLTVTNSSMHHIARFAIDCEPLAGDVVHHVTFADNVWQDGRLGFMSVQAARVADVGDITLTRNVWDRGHLHITVAAAFSGPATILYRSGLVITDNVSLDRANPARSAVIDVRGWRGVVVTGNHDFGNNATRALALRDTPTPTVGGNQFVGFRP